jgi:predicted DNA-binding transcriptional regulator AlpA
MLTTKRVNKVYRDIFDVSTSGEPMNKRVEEDGISKALLLNVNKVAEMIDCSPRHVYRLEADGKMPRGLRLGALVRWPSNAIEDWIANGCRPISANATLAV